MPSAEGLDNPRALEILSTTLGGLYVAWNATNTQFATVPSDGCPASRDDGWLAAADPRWARHEGTGAGLDAVQVIDAAAQHVLGLTSYAQNRMRAVIVWPVVRAVNEHIAHAAWLLEPGITPQARMARRWMARLAAAHRYRWAAGARKVTSRQLRDAKKCREAIRGEFLDRFPGADTQWTDPAREPVPSWTIEGERYPNLSQQNRLIEKLGVKNYAGLYDALSLYAHPNSVTLTMQIDRNDTGGSVQVTYPLNLEQWDSAVRAVTTLLGAGAYAACNYFALDTAHLDAWCDNTF